MPQLAQPHSLRQLRHPLAIAMWDFSWLLRHEPPHGPDDFTDWNRNLDELADRGYDAVRIDAFPHWIAPDWQGQAPHEVRVPLRAWKCVTWGPGYTSVVRPRPALIDFMTRCRDRGIRVGLSTWFQGHDEHQRNRNFLGLDGFVHAWDATLRFLDEHGLLHDALYLDLLNEYPLWHGFDWLHDQIASLADPTAPGSPGSPDSPDSPAHPESAGPPARDGDAAHVWSVGKPYNARQRRFANAFIRDAVAELSSRWPNLPIFASFSHSPTVPWAETTTQGFGALDVHVWAVHHPDCFAATGYLEDMHPLNTDAGFARCQHRLKTWWQANRAEVEVWMDAYLGTVAEAGRRLDVPVGNTEGWGPINWTNHPTLDWDLVREGGDLGVKLALKHGYRFICTSNFTHPMFTDLWADLAWHRDLTERIRRATLAPLADLPSPPSDPRPQAAV